MNQDDVTQLDDPTRDKNGEALDRQRFRMLEDIARELSGDIVFPTSFDAIMQIRRAMQDPNISLARMAGVITLEPLISTRIVALANSAFYNPGGGTIRDLVRAIERLGLQVVRTTAMAIAMKQLLLARNVVAFQDQANGLWQHSLRTASTAYVVARRLTRISPDDAMLAGMVHDIGAFYMIYRASQYEELVLRPDTAKYLVMRWHESVGHSLVIALGLPAEIADAVIDHDQLRAIPEPPKSLADVVYLANLLAGGRFEWMDLSQDLGATELEKLHAVGAALNDEIDSHEAALKAALS